MWQLMFDAISKVSHIVFRPKIIFSLHWYQSSIIYISLVKVNLGECHFRFSKMYAHENCNNSACNYFDKFFHQHNP